MRMIRMPITVCCGKCFVAVLSCIVLSCIALHCIVLYSNVCTVSLMQMIFFVYQAYSTSAVICFACSNFNDEINFLYIYNKVK